MRRMKKLIIVLTAAFFLNMIPYTVLSEETGADILMRGQCDQPVKIIVSSPTYKMISQFGGERTDSLNRLLQHLSLSVAIDGNISETTVMVDQEQVYSYTEETDGSVTKTVYSVLPDSTYWHTEEKSGMDSVFSDFLEEHFFSLNRLLDDLYTVFEKTAEVFNEYAKSSTVSLNFSGYGKGVRRITIPLPDQYIKEKYHEVITGLAETGESRGFVDHLIFSGPQKIILLYDQNDHLLRINYDGVVGLTEESMRKVSVVWRCVRSAGQKKDNLTLKTPAVKGYDKYNITYERTVDFSDPECHVIKWDMQLDIRDREIKKKIAFNADMVFKEDILDGKTVFSEKQDGNETKKTIITKLQKENSDEYNGTIEITNYSGKIVTSSAEYSVCVSRGTNLTIPDNHFAQESEDRSGDKSFSEDLIRDQLADMLIRRLLLLPDEDIRFLNMDIPEEIWESLVTSLY